MILWQLQDFRSGLQFVGAIGGFLVLTAGLVHVLLMVLKRARVKNLVWRQALKGLFRPDNATRPIMITLTAALAVIFTIFTVETNLDHDYVQSYPPDAPNLFFLDIQPDQRADFDRALGINTRYFPIVRAKILSIDGHTIDRKKEQLKPRGDNLARTFNLTYRSDLLDDEVIKTGSSLFRSDWQELQVSVLDTVLKMHDMKIGDRTRLPDPGHSAGSENFKYPHADQGFPQALFLLRISGRHPEECPADNFHGRSGG